MNNMQIMNQHTDEVDIVELMKMLWLGKKIIIGCIILFSVIATIYALTAQQWWTSSAIVTTGQYRGIAELRQQVVNFYVVANNQDKGQKQNTDQNRNNVNELNKTLNDNKLLNQFIVEFNAFNNKKDFILSNPIMKEYANGKDDTVFINNWAKKIQASLTNKKEPGKYTLSYQATNAKLSYQLLLAYTHFIDKKRQREVFDELGSIIKNNILEVKSELLSLKLQAKQLKQQELVKTDYALKIANSAKANKPMSQMNNDQIFSIDLGSEGLAEKLKILKQIKDLSLFEPRIVMARTNLDLLSKINLNRNIKIETISYLQNIGYPMTRDKPKRALILLLGSLLGCMLGVAIVLFKSALHKKQE